MSAFNYDLNYRKLNLREFPELYRVGRGEQGVLLVEPYKSELLPHWRFKTPFEAKVSARALVRAFHEYRRSGDFVGMDMARKFIQMGFTRSRRYANHRSGKKYDGPVPKTKRGQSGAHGRTILRREEDPVKAQSALIFKKAWDKIERNRTYLRLRKDWKLWYG